MDTNAVRSDGRAEVRTETTTTVTYSFEERSQGSPMTLDTPAGPVVVDPAKAVWGTTRASILGLRRTEGTAPGDSVIAVGRLRDGRMRSTGPESLFLFSAPSDARANARSRLRGHRVVIATLAILALVVGAVGVWDITRDERPLRERLADGPSGDRDQWKGGV